MQHHSSRRNVWTRLRLADLACAALRCVGLSAVLVRSSLVTRLSGYISIHCPAIRLSASTLASTHSVVTAMSDSSLLHALAGAGAGCASLAITYPLYARMVRQQVHERHAPGKTGAGADEPPPSRLVALQSELRGLLTPAGLRVHFAGLSAALWAVTVQSGCYYYFFQAFKNLHGISTSPLGNILVGTEAGVATVMLTNPLWVINSRQITRAPTPTPTAAPAAPAAAAGDASVAPASAAASASASASDAASASSAAAIAAPAPVPQSVGEVGFFTAFRQLVAREGLGGVYSGVGPALILVSSPAIQFGAYEWLRALLVQARSAALLAAGNGGVAHLSSLDFFLLGALSKVLATLLTYPIQTLKSQLQKDQSPYARLGWLGGLRACVLDMARSPEGPASFYRGLRAKILQTGLTAAFLFVFRERLIWILSRWAAAAAHTPVPVVKAVLQA